MYLAICLGMLICRYLDNYLGARERGCEANLCQCLTLENVYSPAENPISSYG